MREGVISLCGDCWEGGLISGVIRLSVKMVYFGVFLIFTPVEPL